MIEPTEKQLANANYNLSQAQVGGILKTLNGSKIRRSKFNVGKAIGGSIYLHKSYHEVLPSFLDITIKNDLYISLRSYNFS